MYIIVFLYWFIQIILTILLYYFSFKILLFLYTMTPWYKGNVPYVPTRAKVLKKGFKLLKIKENDNVVDIGSGDGRFIIYGAKRIKANFTGIEFNMVLWIISLVKVLFVRKRGDIAWIRGNYMNVPLSGFNKVFLFNMPSQIKILLPKLKKELKPGTLLFSGMFPLQSSSFKLIEIFREKKHKHYLYEFVGG